MNSERVFETESIDLAAFLTTAGHSGKVYRGMSGHRAVFEFPDSGALREAVIDYERGAALPAKRLLNARSWLFREASNTVKKSGGRGISG